LEKIRNEVTDANCNNTHADAHACADEQFIHGPVREGRTRLQTKKIHTDINDDARFGNREYVDFTSPDLLVAQIERCRSSRSCRRSYLPFSAATFITGARQPYLFRQASFASKWLKQLSLCGLERGSIGLHQSRCGILDALEMLWSAREVLQPTTTAGYATEHDGSA